MDLERVKVRDCPTGLHNGEGDWVALARTLPLDGGLMAEQDAHLAAMHSDDATEISLEVQRRWATTFIKYGAREWNFHDENNEPLDFDVQTILDDYDIARPLADSAADLYSESVLRPFRQRQATRSPTGRTAAMTSKARRRTRRQSGPSSPGTSADSPPLTP